MPQKGFKVARNGKFLRTNGFNSLNYATNTHLPEIFDVCDCHGGFLNPVVDDAVDRDGDAVPRQHLRHKCVTIDASCKYSQRQTYTRCKANVNVVIRYKR